MTQYIYIASPVRLPTGSFGEVPVSPDRPNVFANELDFTHLYFENNYDVESKKRFSYSPHFTYKHQVTAEASCIPLKCDKIRSREAKCLKLLYLYVKDALQAGGALECFTCINGEEELPLSKKRYIRWSELKEPHDLVIEDRDFWEITY